MFSLRKSAYFFLTFLFLLPSLYLFPISRISASELYPNPIKRFGADIEICSKMDLQDIAILENEVKAGWFMNWNLSQWENYGGTYTIEHTPLVGVWKNFKNYGEFKTDLEAELAKSPDSYKDGTVWIIGNEIGYTPGVEEDSPGAYVDKFVKYRGFINQFAQEKGKSGYRFAMGSVFPLDKYHKGEKGTKITGIDYVERVLETYKNENGQTKMPVDVFTIDPFNFPPASPTSDQRLENQIKAFRKMMQEKGYKESELWIKEWGNLWHEGYPDTSVENGAKYVEDSVKLFLSLTDGQTGLSKDDNRLVQRWSWFYYNGGDKAWACPDHDGGKYGQMYNAKTNTLTPVGEKYKSMIEFAQTMPTIAPRVGEGAGFKEDLDRDGNLDIFDYNKLVKDFGKKGRAGFTASDINKDGKVDKKDYDLLLAKFREAGW